MSEEVNYCNQCGAKISSSTKFCSNCGCDLHNSSTRTPLDQNIKLSGSSSQRGLGWVSLGAALAGLSVMLGAFGAHSLKANLSEKKLATFHTATDYLGYHALALIAIGILISILNEKIEPKLKRSSRWISSGILLFSGSLYVLTFDGPRIFGPITPLGGICFMIGWLTLAISLFKYSKNS